MRGASLLGNMCQQHACTSVAELFNIHWATCCLFQEQRVSQKLPSVWPPGLKRTLTGAACKLAGEDGLILTKCRGYTNKSCMHTHLNTGTPLTHLGSTAGCTVLHLAWPQMVSHSTTLTTPQWTKGVQPEPRNA